MGTTRLIAIACLPLVALAGLACHRQVLMVDDPDEAPAFATDSRVDPGAAMLAGVDNARVALAQGDPLVADNDLAQALAYAVELPGESSRLFPDQIQSKAPAGVSRLPRFGAQVRLQSAASELENGDAPDADADLAAIQAGVPSRLRPANLPLIEASQSLALARVAAESNQPRDLALQLATAEAALAVYSAAPHRADARALGSELGRALHDRSGVDAIKTDQLALWATKIGGWL